jgi:transcriptional regulator with XRE-family HTH domain
MKESQRGAPSSRNKGPGAERLLGLLVAEAVRRNETLTDLAHHLGVTYGRLAQWRRGEGSIRTANPNVLAAAAQYLQIPRLLALAFAGSITLEDLEWPSPLAKEQRLYEALQQLAACPMLGPFVPPSLGAAPLEIRAFVVLLFRELQSIDSARPTPWFTSLRDTLGLLEAMPSTSG